MCAMFRSAINLFNRLDNGTSYYTILPTSFIEFSTLSQNTTVKNLMTGICTAAYQRILIFKFSSLAFQSYYNILMLKIIWLFTLDFAQPKEIIIASWFIFFNVKCVNLAWRCLNICLSFPEEIIRLKPKHTTVSRIGRLT